jgi:hypothetical protein
MSVKPLLAPEERIHRLDGLGQACPGAGKVGRRRASGRAHRRTGTKNQRRTAWAKGEMTERPLIPSTRWTPEDRKMKRTVGAIQTRKGYFKNLKNGLCPVSFRSSTVACGGAVRSIKHIAAPIINLGNRPARSDKSNPKHHFKNHVSGPAIRPTMKRKSSRLTKISDCFNRPIITIGRC